MIRVWGDKPGVLVVDYLGPSTALRAALAQYTERDRDQVKLDLDEAVRLTLSRSESAEALLDEVVWKRFFGASPGERLTVLKQCLEHLLSTQRRDRFVDVGLELETAYAIVAGDERITPRRDETSLMTAVRANLLKYDRRCAQPLRCRARHSAAPIPSRYVEGNS